MFQQEEDISLDHIDYEWIEKQTSIKNLRRALQVLKHDGSHYPDLERAIDKRIEEVNPAASKNVINNQNIDPEVKRLEEEGLYEWANGIKEKELAKQRAAEARGTGDHIFQTSVPEASNVTSFSDLSEDERKKQAENYKNKGNEAVRSQDYKEALQYYTKSIQFYNKIAATYSNRALCYLKLKDYKSCIADCNKTLDLDGKFIKAFHRRAKANFEMGNYGDAVVDFQRVMDLDPNNAEVNAELMEARNKFNKGKSTKSANLTKPSEFKKITIQEEDEESEEEEEEQPTKKAAEGTNTFDRIVDDMLLEEGKSTLENKFKTVEELKTKANDLLKTGLYEKAIIEYQKGLNILNNIKLSNVAPESETDLSNKKAVLFNNIGYCYMQMDQPDSVVSYTTKVFELENVTNDTLVKAYLRRGLAYEKMDKIAKALQDFESVKHLNPSDMTATKALHRLHVLINKDEDLKRSIEKSRSQELPKVQSNNKENAPPKKSVSEVPQASSTNGGAKTVDIEATYTECEALKTKGNDFFKEKNLASAIKTFYEAQAKIEESLKQGGITSDARSRIEKLYVQILSNTAMCCFNLNEIEKTLENCEKALILEPAHPKCLYRKALCKQKIGDTFNADTKLAEVDRKKKQLDLYQEAKKILEQVLQVDKANKDVMGKLQDVVRTIERTKIDYKQFAEKKAPVKKEESKPAAEEAKQTSDSSPKKARNPTPGIDKEYFENITKNAAKAVTESLISNEELPETSSRFETNCQGFKKNIDKLYFYVKKIPGDYLAGLYKQKGFPIDYFLNMVESIKASGLNDDAESCAKFLQTITRTYKFELLVKQLIKKDRKDIKAILDQIQKSHPAEVEALYDKYNCKDI